MRKLIITIELGHDATTKGSDVSRLVREYAKYIREPGFFSRMKTWGTTGIMDPNGNKVGSIEVKEDGACSA